MDKEQQDRKRFLEEQVEWCKKQDAILQEIEGKLYKMKEIAEYSCNNETTELENEKLNNQLNTLKQEVHFLEQMLQSVVH